MSELASFHKLVDWRQNAFVSHFLEMPEPTTTRLGLRLRAATVEDRLQIIDVVNRAFAIETFFDGTRTDEARISEMMRRGGFLVAEDEDGEIAACVFVESRGERGYFGMLSVDPARKGTGLGRTMVEAAENWCRARGHAGVDITVLNMRPELPPFYRKLGYEETGTEEFHPTQPLKEGVTCYSIVMSKTFA